MFDKLPWVQLSPLFGSSFKLPGAPLQPPASASAIPIESNRDALIVPNPLLDSGCGPYCRIPGVLLFTKRAPPEVNATLDALICPD